MESNVADAYWAEVQARIEDTVKRMAVIPRRATVSSVMADRTVKLNLEGRITTKSYPVVNSSIPPVVGDVVTVLNLPGGRVVLGQDLTGSTPTLASKFDKAGGSVTGPVSLPGNPSTALQAAPKQYVDAGVKAVDDKLPAKYDKTGGTITGDIALTGMLTQRVAIASTWIPAESSVSWNYALGHFPRIVRLYSASSSSAWRDLTYDYMYITAVSATGLTVLNNSTTGGYVSGYIY